MKLLRLIADMIAAILILLGVLLTALRIQGVIPYIVLSGSMEPAIPAGGLVFTDTGERSPSVGEVITYQLGDQTVTHRIVRRDKNEYITKGDANNGEDLAPVSASQITGTVLFSLPYLGYAFHCLQTVSPAYLILIMIVLSFFLDIHISSMKKTTAKKGERAHMHAVKQ